MAYAIGFSIRKAAYLADFTGEHVVRVTDSHDVEPTSRYYVWGSHALPAGVQPGQVTYVEDGFMRSCGLGAAFAEPLSWVFDQQGLHHCATKRTDLEAILSYADVGIQDLRRAAALRRRIVDSGLTKYNVGSKSWGGLPAVAEGRVKVLVVGQVPGDAAVTGIDSPIRTNHQLLVAARELNPDAFLIYKPHPDVVAGLRDGDDELGKGLADMVVSGPSIHQVLVHVDEVHVVTSLAGFEALLRGKRVVCHANPFYAGWGLTHDRFPIDRRKRRRSLDELVYLCLIAYPRYRSPTSRKPCAVEDVVQVLEERSSSMARMPRLIARMGLAAGRLLRTMGRTGAAVVAPEVSK